MNNQIDFKMDSLIKSEAQDKFGWSAYAKKVAATIQSVDAEDSSFVVALQGSWGSGRNFVSEPCRKRAFRTMRMY